MTSLKLLAPTLLVLAILAAGSFAPAHAETFSISGTFWEDRNADGTRQSDEPGIGYYQIELGKIENGVARFYDDTGFLPLFRNTEGRSVRPDESGRYTFPNLEPGNYVLRLPIGGGGNVFFMTHPIRRGYAELSTSVRIESQSLTGVDIGVYYPRTEVMRLSGLAWVDAAPFSERPSESSIHAFIEGTDCTGPGGILPTDLAPNTYSLGVMSESLVPGCGTPGKVVRFEIDGRPANETVIWQPVTALPPGISFPGQTPQQRPVDLTVGPPFAHLIPELIDPSGTYFPLRDNVLQALVDGVSCGRVFPSSWDGYFLTVPSTDYPGGCGYPGAQIQLRLDGENIGPLVPWRPGQIEVDNVRVSQRSPYNNDGEQTADEGVIRPPNAGDAGLAH